MYVCVSHIIGTLITLLLLLQCRRLCKRAHKNLYYPRIIMEQLSLAGESR